MLRNTIIQTLGDTQPSGFWNIGVKCIFHLLFIKFLHFFFALLMFMLLMPITHARHCAQVYCKYYSIKPNSAAYCTMLFCWLVSRSSHISSHSAHNALLLMRPHISLSLLAYIYASKRKL